MTDRRVQTSAVRDGVSTEEDGALETAAILFDPAAIAALEEGFDEIERGETVTLTELRGELAALRLTID